MSTSPPYYYKVAASNHFTCNVSLRCILCVGLKLAPSQKNVSISNRSKKHDFFISCNYSSVGCASVSLSVRFFFATFLKCTSTTKWSELTFGKKRYNRTSHEYVSCRPSDIWLLVHHQIIHYLHTLNGDAKAKTKFWDKICASYWNYFSH